VVGVEVTGVVLEGTRAEGDVVLLLGLCSFAAAAFRDLAAVEHAAVVSATTANAMKRQIGAQPLHPAERGMPRARISVGRSS
jgi:hypothetical protein